MTASPIVLTSVPPLAGSSARTDRQKSATRGGGVVVAVRLGQGCEAGDVCEHDVASTVVVSGMPLNA